jgi:alpha-L-rhamnosidase
MAMALYLGLVPEGPTRTAVEAALIKNVVSKNNGHLTTGLVGTKYLLPALSSISQAGLEVAYTLATQDTIPSWGYWIKMGATTLYESWIEAGTLEQRANNAGSLNHIMLGSQMDWYYKVLAGINLPPNTRGWANLTLAPRVPAKLRWVRAETNTVRGIISSSWMQTQGSSDSGVVFAYNFSVPIGSAATVELPPNIVHAKTTTVSD